MALHVWGMCQYETHSLGLHPRKVFFGLKKASLNKICYYSQSPCRSSSLCKQRVSAKRSSGRSLQFGRGQSGARFLAKFAVKIFRPCFAGTFRVRKFQQKLQPNTVSESTVSNTELSEFSCLHRAPGRGLSEFLSAYYLCSIANSPSSPQNSPSLPQNSVCSLFQNSALETVFRPFPNFL